MPNSGVAAGSKIMTSNWLEAYLLDAVSKKLCTKIHCTTCGALDFRRGVLGIAEGEKTRDLAKSYHVSISTIARL
jgi:hypothetical protein